SLRLSVLSRLANHRDEFGMVVFHLAGHFGSDSICRQTSSFLRKSYGLLEEGETGMHFKTDTGNKKDRGERGAALVTVLLISTLMLATGGALILLTSATSRNAIDSTAEMQAYYAAEAGMQNTLNVLRGNVSANAAMPSGTTINFRKAIDLTTSNL